MDVHGIDLPISEAGEAAKYIASRNAKAAPGGNVTHTVLVDPVVVDPAPKAAAALETDDAVDPKAEPWTDPETGDPKEKPTRGDKRLSRLWQEREAEKQMRLAAEKRLADAEARLAERPAAPSRSEPQTAAEADALTTAAQERIRAKPDRGAIGSTYPTYEDYVEDCAIWGGELAAEKRVLLTESHQAQTAADQAQNVFAQERTAAKADYPDFETVTTQDIALSQAIVDATVHAPAGLKGHVLYWLGKHPDETARIAALPSGPALVAMGEVIALVRADRAAAKPSGTTTPKPKPKSDAPDPPEPIKGAASHDTPPHRVADPGAARVNPVDWIKGRNAEVGTRRRI